MPPAISDDEGSDVGTTRKAASKKARQPTADEFDEEDYDMQEEEDTKKTNGGADEDDEEDEDMEEDEYVVEKIFSHYIAKDGKPRFEVKWEGYDKKADRTWEEEDNLKENAADILNEYFKSLGGREKLFEETKEALASKKRKSSTPAEGKRSKKQNNGHPLDSTPPASARAAEWKPPSGSWDDHIGTVDMAVDDDSGDLIVYLGWKNGKKTQHPKEVAYRRCPMNMLRFYERHLRISREGAQSVAIDNLGANE